MKNSLLASAAIVSITLGAVPAFAQGSGPFADVPADHWAYAAVDKLQRQGIVIGYPDGTYGGKRAMTRYEFAVAIARLLDKIPPAVDLSNYVTKDQLGPYALKSDLAGLAKQSDVDALRRLVNEFQTELTTLGVDIDAIKKRLDSLEGRVKALEDDAKRVRVSGAINLMGRGNNRFRTSINSDLGAGNDATSVRDADGFEVTGGAGSRGGILQDSRVFHDVDLNVRTILSDVASAEATINYGNYLPFLNGIATIDPNASFRSDRVAAGLYPGQRANQDEQFTVYKAQIQADVNTPIGGLKLTAGRMPMQINPYTLKLVDSDYYFYNSKTDLGDVPLDGARGEFRVGPVGVMVFGAKVDPIKFVSNQDSNISGDRNYGLYAGAAYGGYSGFQGTGGLQARSRVGVTSTGATYITGNRPVGSVITPETNGAMGVEQMAGARGAFSYSKIGTLGVTYLYMSGNQTFDPVAGASGDLRDRSFNRVQVFSLDGTAAFGGGFNVGAYYTESDTKGDDFNDLTTTTRRSNDNAALDIFGHFAHGAFDINGGYRRIDAYFGAPGYWARVGSLTNPTDIEGGYGKIGYRLSKQLGLAAEVQIYNGRGDAENNGGLNSDDRINNYRGGLKYALGSLSNFDTGVEVTQYDISNGLGGRTKPSEFLWNLGYGYSFSQNSAIKVGYQYIQYFDRGAGFDTAQGAGGVATTQFTVKF